MCFVAHQWFLQMILHLGQNTQKVKLFHKPTLVKYGASIGANATIVCGNTIGKWAMIASGAVVTKDVVDYALMAGIPAKHIGWGV